MKLKDMKLTIIHPFYNDGGTRLPLQFEAWKTYPDWVWDVVNVILIDDGSAPTLESHYPKDNGLNFNLKIYRINEDLRYNVPGAWNLGFHVAETDWVYAFDSDHVHTVENFIRVLELDVEDDRFYQLSKRRHTNIETQRALGRIAGGSWLVRKEHWAAVGGLDEELTGERSNSRGYWDPDFSWRLRAVAKITVPEGIVVEEYMPDYFGLSSNPHKGWKNLKNRRRHAAKKSGKIEHPTDMLRFMWEQVYEQRRTDV